MSTFFLIFILLCFYHYYIENVVVPLRFLELQLDADDLAHNVLEKREKIPKPSFMLILEGLFHLRFRLDQKSMNDLLLVLLPKFFQHTVINKNYEVQKSENTTMVPNIIVPSSAEDPSSVSFDDAEVIYKRMLSLLTSGFLVNMRGWHIYLWIVSVALSPIFLVLFAFKKTRAIIKSTVVKVKNRVNGVLMAQIY